MQVSFRSFGLGLILATVLVYLILVAQFKSFLDPLLILLAVPTGLTGVLIILFATGTTLNVMSLMGVVMMVGIVVSNSILIVEFTHRLREEGRPLREAVSLACRVRLRPVLMTSLATLIGLIPMALKLGTGSEAYAPLARAIIGGLAVSVVLTVFIVPCAYFILYRRKETAAKNPRHRRRPRNRIKNFQMKRIYFGSDRFASSCAGNSFGGRNQRRADRFDAGRRAETGAAKSSADRRRQLSRARRAGSGEGNPRRIFSERQSLRGRRRRE